MAEEWVMGGSAKAQYEDMKISFAIVNGLVATKPGDTPRSLISG
jgi:hypothetical protein